MKTNQITTESGIVLLLVEVPEGLLKFKVVNSGLCVSYPVKQYRNCIVNLPEGNWQGKHFKEMSESDCQRLIPDKIICSEIDDGLTIAEEWGFADLVNEEIAHETAHEVILSAIKYHGFDPETTVVLTLKK